MSTKPETALAALNLDDLNKLAKWLEKSGLEEVEIESAGTRLRLKKPSIGGTFTPAPAPQAPLAAAAPAVEADSAKNAFTSPMVGTFYTSASPESGPFVKVGDSVKIGQTLCIIEAMKTMNQIAATHAGVVEKVLVANATPVEFGQPLFIIK